MYLLLSFPVILMVVLAFTLVAKRVKRGARQKPSGGARDDPPCHEIIAEDLCCETPVKSLVTKGMDDNSGPDAVKDDGPVPRSFKDRMAEVEAENARLKAEVLKLKNRGQKKKENLAGYHEGNKKVRMATRKRRASKLAAARVGTTNEDDEIVHPNKRTGKPKGSNGGGFKLPKKIDREVEWRLDQCPRCGKSLAGTRPCGTWSHVIIDFVKFELGARLERVQHLIHRYRCPGCHQLVTKDFGPLAHMHYGIGLISVVMEERIARRGTWDGIRGTLIRFFGRPDDEEDVNGVDSIIPTIVAFIDWMARWEPQVKRVFEAFLAAVKDTSFAHVDETGVPMDGKNYWLWIVVTGHVILYLASESRGHETIKDIFEDYEGILISDFWSAYNKLSAEQQKCLAHLVKDLRTLVCKAIDSRDGIEKKLAEASLGATAAGRVDGDATNEGIKPRRGRKPKQPAELSDEERATLAAGVEQQAKIIKQVEMLRAFFKGAWDDGDMGWKTPEDKRISRREAVRRMRRLIEQVRAEGAASPDIERLLKRMEKFAQKLFAYLDHPGTPPDNNAAERGLRPFVVQRKISGNFVNPDVFEVYAMMLSLYHTGLKHKVPFRDVLRLLHHNDVDGVLTLLGLEAPPPPPPPDLATRAHA